MRTGRPKKPVVLSKEEREQLESLGSSRSLPYALVNRARIILRASNGWSNAAIGEQLGLSAYTVGKWRGRYLAQGIEGLHDELRPGRPRSISDDQVAGLIRKTLGGRPRKATHWSVRRMAEETALSRSTVHRIWRAFGLQPHRQRHFKLSTDPFFVDKVRDIVGLYLSPPDKAMVLCVDEKSRIQALEPNPTDTAFGVGLCRRRHP